ncbi:MAG: NAD(P)H-dependent glycerol-3-phosphate dehydrogenase, partial [Candidatus Edwardsbacteria bacterium]|nr:NAD(P)H-dependent glycerol-3-phosphate dehydrogenase [Candidatus Edwardsbacteria bacterium]
HDIRLWEFQPEAASRMARTRENREFLPGINIPNNALITSDIGTAIDRVQLCIFAVPSHVLREVCEQAKPFIPDSASCLSVIKGLENGTLLRMSQVMAEVLKEKAAKLSVLSGPNIAWEIARKQPSTSVAASLDPLAAEEVRSVLMTPQFRIYTSNDMAGLELGGALKNVIAIASGIVQGLGLGANALGALLTRGLAEIIRLGVTMGAKPETFAGLSGMGDLVTTCFSPHSRNRTVGEQIGKGRKLRDILASMTMVAEGVKTTEAACELAGRHGVEMPIAEQMRQVLFCDKDPRRAVADLMTRNPKAEGA